jgi:hypothetical protein
MNEQMLTGRKQAEKQYSDWENSLEEILYNLRTMAATTIADENDKVLIAETLQRIPARVRTKFLGEAVFVLMNGLYGIVINGYFNRTISRKDLVELPARDAVVVTVRQGLIFLNFGEMKKLSKKRKMDIIAHEIAHFVLKHHLKTSVRSKEGMKMEKEADDLIVKWGFDRGNIKVTK